MPTDQERFSRLVRHIYTTQSDEIQCDQAADLMVLSTAALLSGEESRQQYPALWRHLERCVDCAAEYRMLLELTQMDVEGALPPAVAIPPVPAREQRASVQWLQDALTVLFPGFSPALSSALARGETLGLEPVLMPLSGNISLELDVDRNATDPSHRDLFCRVEAADPALLLDLEGTPLWLQVEDEGPVVQEQVLDDLGGAIFSALQPGVYNLYLQMNRQVYVVRALVLP
jgi:hypothetical protein